MLTIRSFKPTDFHFTRRIAILSKRNYVDMKITPKGGVIMVFDVQDKEEGMALDSGIDKIIKARDEPEVNF